MTELAKNIAVLMEQKHWNAKNLASEAKQKPSAVYNILNGRSKKPSAEKIEAIAKALGVTTTQLLHGTSIRPGFVTDDTWDGLLYHDSMTLVYSIFKRKNIQFHDRNEEKNVVMKLTSRIYNFAAKRGEHVADRIFAEDIINEMFE